LPIIVVVVVSCDINKKKKKKKEEKIFKKLGTLGKKPNTKIDFNIPCRWLVNKIEAIKYYHYHSRLIEKNILRVEFRIDIMTATRFHQRLEMIKTQQALSFPQQTTIRLHSSTTYNRLKSLRRRRRALVLIVGLYFNQTKINNVCYADQTQNNKDDFFFY
jgi:hypothetical protein